VRQRLARVSGCADHFGKGRPTGEVIGHEEQETWTRGLRVALSRIRSAIAGDLQPILRSGGVLWDAAGSVECASPQNEADVDLAAVAHGAVEIHRLAVGSVIRLCGGFKRECATQLDVGIVLRHRCNRTERERAQGIVERVVGAIVKWCLHECVLGFVGAALREALLGNPVEPRNQAAGALDLSKGTSPQFLAALALVLPGDTVRSRTLADELGNRFREYTIVQSYYLPTIRAQLALSRNDPSTAIEILKSAAPYGLSSYGKLYPVYVRGESYLVAHQGHEAATEFQKIIDHRGIVTNAPIGALAHLGLGRAYALLGDRARQELPIGIS
jgi:hypothetical protein